MNTTAKEQFTRVIEHAEEFGLTPDQFEFLQLLYDPNDQFQMRAQNACRAFFFNKWDLPTQRLFTDPIPPIRIPDFSDIKEMLNKNVTPFEQRIMTEALWYLSPDQISKLEDKVKQEAEKLNEVLHNKDIALCQCVMAISSGVPFSVVLYTPNGPKLQDCIDARFQDDMER